MERIAMIAVTWIAATVFVGGSAWMVVSISLTAESVVAALSLAAIGGFIFHLPFRYGAVGRK